MAKSTIRLVADVVTFSFIGWTLFRTVQFYFFPPKQAISRYRKKPHSYALVTGASAGIGFGFAQELISHGFGVILIASREGRLKAAADKLKAEYPTADIRTIVYNAKNVDGLALSKALEPIMNLPINILVNNVGGISVLPPIRPLTDYPPQDVIDTINMNTIFMTQLTRIMIPVLDRNGPSLMLGISSAGQVGIPWLVPYSASKAFVTSFCTGISREARAAGLKIDSLAIVAGEIYSEGNSEGLAPGSPTSRQFAKMVLDRAEMAVDRRMWVISPYWQHAIQQTMLDKMPERVVQSLLTSTFKTKLEMQAKSQ